MKPRKPPRPSGARPPPPTDMPKLFLVMRVKNCATTERQLPESWGLHPVEDSLRSPAMWAKTLHLLESCSDVACRR